jgi:hypothetical protein
MIRTSAARRALAVALVLTACSDSSTPTDPGASSSSASSSGASTSSSSGASASSSSGASGDASSPLAAGWQKAFKADGVKITCAMTEAELTAAGAPSLTFAGSTIFVGFEQVGQNQNPIVARFDGGASKYCVKSEEQGPDGRALGVTWDGGATAFVVYTIVGGGSALDAKAKGGWLDRYGDGGGSSKVTFIGAIDAASGAIDHGTFVIAKKQDGKTNSHTPRDAVTRLEDGRIELLGSSAFQPMNPDRTIMQCTDYPFDTRYIFSADLTTLTCSSSTSCTSAVACPP